MMPPVLSAKEFNRQAWAQWYAKQHFFTDPGILAIHYLPDNAPDREIRLVEVNELMGESEDDSLEPVNFGVDIGKEVEHALYALDVTPGQWERIERGELELPLNWRLENRKSWSR